MNQSKIVLISYGYFENSFLKRIEEIIKNEFNCNVNSREEFIDLNEYYNPERRQYDANKLLHFIDNNYHFNDSKIIGLFNVDLFIPIFTYIFGQAFLNGKAGIVSVYRLSNIRYGIKPDNEIFIQRFSKEIIHELGHTFGMIHCFNNDCVMLSSNYVEEIDQKGYSFCKSCKEKLHKIN